MFLGTHNVVIVDNAQKYTSSFLTSGHWYGDWSPGSKRHYGMDIVYMRIP